MNRTKILSLGLVLLLAAFVGCGQKSQSVADRTESQEAKQLLQGVWMDEETETVVFQMKGDSVYYADSTSMPVYFKVIADTLYMGSAAYHIEKHSTNVLWFKNQQSETAKYVKSDDQSLDSVFEKSVPQIQTLTEVLKRDTVVFHNGERYHCYIAINPTKYKVVRNTVNADGLVVENVYYDNIIHVSIFKGARQLFSSDFRKTAYTGKVPEQFLSQAVFNDMRFNKADEQGFHFNASLCVPDEASCYLVDHLISYSGKVSTKLLEY